MTCIIVDDNKIARITMRQIASLVTDLVISKECSSAAEVVDYLQENTIDLILLDIEMPGMNGIELTKNLGNKRPLIIFTTSKKEYAVEAFELNVADYIVKPVTPARFVQAIEKARDLLASNTEEVTANEEEFMFIRESNIIRRMKMDQILYAEAMGDYVKLHTTQKFYAIHSTLKAVEARLPVSNFLRIHRSFIVAINKIDTIQEGSVIVNAKSIPIADTYRAALTKKINIV
jgi:DNA-binding LytR/AlgR family response regulator